ncbi:MAG: hypothetical protein N3E41_05775 [Thermofilaceae archaeon]|nr:hypothetical protein [Thermofilaceae archaeon]
MDCFNTMRRALESFEKARTGEKAVTVTQVARRVASSRSHKGSARAGVAAHNVWGDPLEACSKREYWTPLPLAHQVKRVWVYGVADLVGFLDGSPVEVVELKHYSVLDKYSIVQASIYAWLTAKVFNVAPRAYVVLGWNGRGFTEKFQVVYTVEKVEVELEKALERMGYLVEA